MDNINSPNVRQLVSSFLQSLPCHIHTPYPSPIIHQKNTKVANLLLNAYGDGGNAEFTAVAQYMHHSLTIDNSEVSDVIYCIALTEMHHLELVGHMIHSLGGNPKYWRSNQFYWTGGLVEYGSNLCDKIISDILAEQEAIAGYEALLKLIHMENDPSIQQVEKVIRRIIEDEVLHLSIFQRLHENFCRTSSNHTPHPG